MPSPRHYPRLVGARARSHFARTSGSSVKPSTCVATALSGSSNAGRAIVPSYEDQERRQLENRRAHAELDAARSRQRGISLREKVGGLVAEGKCDDARKVALTGGDFDLADLAAKSCSPEAH